MTDKHSVACTVIAKDGEGDYVFLLENQSKGYGFLNTEVSKNKTGLASIIEKVKAELKVSVAELELFELTNAVVEKNRIPLFVFSCRNEELDFNDLLVEGSTLSWQHTENLSRTFKKWQISGVPQFQQE